MARELTFGPHTSGATIYGVLQRVTDGYVRDVVAGAWDAPLTADVADYDIALAEDDTTGFYAGDLPAGVTLDGSVRLLVYSAATLAPGDYLGSSVPLPIVAQVSGHTAQTGDSYARLGAPAGASIAADVAACASAAALQVVDDELATVAADVAGLDGAAMRGTDSAATASSLATLATTVGAAGAGLSGLPWNAAWDAEVQSECADALTAFAPATAAALATVDGIVDTIALDVAGLDGAAMRGTDSAATASALATLDTSVNGLVTDVGSNGAGLTSLPWNASWDAEVQSECADALTAFDAATAADVPSASTVAAAVWAVVLENGRTAAQIARGLWAIARGKTSGMTLGVGTAVFRNDADTADRLSGVIDSNGNRTTSTVVDLD